MPADPTSIEVAETLALAFFAAWEAHDWPTVARLLSEDFHLTGITSAPMDKELTHYFQCVLNDALPNWAFNVGNVVAHGNTVHVQVHVKATHSGLLDVQLFGLPLPLIPPKGQQIALPPQVYTFTVEGEQIVACHVDGGGLMSLLHALRIVGWRLPTPAMN
jgi:predicted ester cyclase